MCVCVKPLDDNGFLKLVDFSTPPPAIVHFGL